MQREWITSWNRKVGVIRAVTHMDVSTDEILQAVRIIEKIVL